MSPRALALLALLLGLGTIGAFVTLLAAFAIPLPPVSYLGALGLAVLLALAAVWRARRWLTVSALVVSVLLLVMASFLNFVAWRVPTTRPLVAVGQPVPDFTLPDAAGRPVTLSDYRGQKPVVLVFYRGYW
jgi:AhpC/TSA family